MTLEAHFRLESNGRWTAVATSPHVEVGGASLHECREKLQVAHATRVGWDRDARRAARTQWIEFIAYPEELERDADLRTEALRALEDADERVEMTTLTLIRRLRSEYSMSVRDIGSLVGLTGSRVHQLLYPKPARERKNVRRTRRGAANRRR